MTSATTEDSHQVLQTSVVEAVAQEARTGLLASPRTLAPWLFYDERGSELFEQITTLPEYYLTRTERSIFAAHAAEILDAAASGHTLTVLELGAGTATKTGILLEAAVRKQGSVLYQPVDVSSSALDQAVTNLESSITGVAVRPQVANYTVEPLTISRPHSPHSGDARVLALYIGSSIGNFSPVEATAVLCNLRAQLRPGDALLLGTDLAPGSNKSVSTLLSAYDDAAGVTAAFNRNILVRLNRDLGTDFDLRCFAHRARWNAALSRIEMHLESRATQRVHLPADAVGPAVTLHFEAGETIHTEDSHKFTQQSVQNLLTPAGFRTTHSWQDPQALFVVTLATAV